MSPTPTIFCTFLPACHFERGGPTLSSAFAPANAPALSLVKGRPAGTDDILNPGFELGLEGWRTWAADSSGSEQVITDSTRAHSGSNYLQLSTTTAQVWTGNQVLAVNPGDQLTFGGWVYLEPGSATGGTIGWNIAVMDANGNVLVYDGAANVTSGAWTFQSVNYTVPPNGASVWLFAQIYGPTGLTTARFDDGFLTGASGLGVRYYHGDHLGSARLMTDSGGNVTWSATYLPFGQEWNPQATTNHYKFTGKERDSESGNDNFGARYNSSSFGRFTSPDPPSLVGLAVDSQDPQSWNAYSYVRNNPLNLSDPDGTVFCRPANPNEGPAALICDVTDADYVNSSKQQQAIYDKAGYKHYDCSCDSGADKDAWQHPNGNVGTDYVGYTIVFATSLAIVKHAFSYFVNDAEEEEETVVIGKVNPDGTLRDTTLGPGERQLELPNQGSPRANWAQNSSKLREAMRTGKPIRDGSAGVPSSESGFLRAERNLLRDHGWELKGDTWYPPNR